MSASNAAGFEAIETDLQGDVRVVCYVRSSVPAAVSERLTALVERLRTLEETGTLADVQVSQWPAEHAIGETDQPTREELVAEFEDWATQYGYSLEPGFCRQHTTPSPLGISEPCESIRVPLVALALYDADTDATDVQGVVPCTNPDKPVGERTYTVDEWLTAVETHASVASTHAENEQRTMLEGSR
ncbi:HTH domain-containing protein [Haloarchaeobius amylolyticus]|uniref:HTH domain-containing protein n=1 Tax=Haloarchaeobius amylolyticus TaxID=1198296 RepID=A0ABD6BER2_9EURY